MDQHKARSLAKQLINKSFRGLVIKELLDNGKSAAVFLAEDHSGKKVALKIFDSELIDRYGHEMQEMRIQQEISLMGHNIPSLVKIIDGGQGDIEGANYFFIAMEFIAGKNLKAFIKSETYAPEFLKQVAQTLHKVTKSLLERNIAHRDIKPENIMVTEERQIILMDLGVIKLIGVPSQSDLDEKQFVGTLRYAPPEFLTRKEEDNRNSWTAINLYQIGAVMHDLIMKTELFAGVSPYTNLVIAINEDAPEVSSSAYAFETVQMTRDLLTKEPQARLRLVSAERFDHWLNSPDHPTDDISKELEAILQLSSENKVKLQEIATIKRDSEAQLEIRRNLSKKLDEYITESVLKLKDYNICSSVSRYPNSFNFHADHPSGKTNFILRNILFEIKGDLENGFSQSLFILSRHRINERSEATIGLLGFLVSPFVQTSDKHDALTLFKQIMPTKTPPNQIGIGIRGFNQQPQITFNLPVYNFFTGTIGFDQQLSERLMLTLVKMVRKALTVMVPTVKAKLEEQEKFARGEVRNSVTMHTGGSKAHFIDEID
jgi:serine/threonine protein kinase